MKVNLMGKRYALNIPVTAEELKEKPAQVIEIDPAARQLLRCPKTRGRASK
jgi:hypothetical protein